MIRISAVIVAVLNLLMLIALKLLNKKLGGKQYDQEKVKYFNRVAIVYLFVIVLVAIVTFAVAELFSQAF